MDTTCYIIGVSTCVFTVYIVLTTTAGYRNNGIEMWNVVLLQSEINAVDGSSGQKDGPDDSEYKYYLRDYQNLKTFQKTTPCPWMKLPEEVRYPRHKSSNLLASCSILT